MTSVSSKRLRLLLSSALLATGASKADSLEGAAVTPEPGVQVWSSPGSTAYAGVEGAAPPNADALADELIGSVPPPVTISQGYPAAENPDYGRVPSGRGGRVNSSPGAYVPGSMGAMTGAPVAGPGIGPELAQYFENAQKSRPTSTSRSPMVPSDVFVLPETLATVAVSNQFVNRVTCPGVVGDVLNSTEKPMEVSTTDGGHIFVKFLVMKDHTGEHLQTAPADLHVVCDGKVYTLILKPQAMDSQTIRLGNPAADQFASTAKEYGALPLEEKIKKITLAVYHEATPAGFQRRRLSDDRRHAKLFRDVIVQGQWEVTAPGLGLKATEYTVHVTKPMTVDARMFLRPEFGAVVGVTVDPPVVSQEQRSARLIIVERSVGK